VVEDGGAAGLGEQLGAEADEAARRHHVVEAHPAAAVVHHLVEPSLARREELRDRAEVLVGHVDRHPSTGSWTYSRHRGSPPAA